METGGVEDYITPEYGYVDSVSVKVSGTGKGVLRMYGASGTSGLVVDGVTIGYPYLFVVDTLGNGTNIFNIPFSKSLSCNIGVKTFYSITPLQQNKNRRWLIQLKMKLK